jgi:hypothetical protein
LTFTYPAFSRIETCFESVGALNSTVSRTKPNSALSAEARQATTDNRTEEANSGSRR